MSGGHAGGQGHNGHKEAQGNGHGGGDDYIAHHTRLYSQAKKLVDTAGQHHMEAYTHAVEKHLKGKDGLIDLKLLDESAVQKQFHKTMSDFYVSKAKAHLKVDKETDELENDMLMGVYAKVTRAELKELITRQGSKLNHITYINEAFRRYIPQLQEQLYLSAGSHLESEHIPGIIKHMGLEDIVDAGKITLQEAQKLLRAHHDQEGGPLTKAMLREEGIPSYKLKKDAHKGKGDQGDEHKEDGGGHAHAGQV